MPSERTAVDQPRHARRPVVAAAREQANVVAVDARDDAVAVELDLVDPAGVARRLGDERRELRAEGLGQLRLDRARRQRERLGRSRACWPTAAPARLALPLRGLRGDVALFAAASSSSARARRIVARRFLRRRGRLVGDRPAREHALRLGVDDAVLGRRPRRVVLLLDQQPRLLALAGAAVHAHQRPAAVQLLAVEAELELAGAVAGARVADRLPGAVVPDDHLARAVLALRDRSLEAAVVDRVVLDVHRHPLVGRDRGSAPSAPPSSSACRRARGGSRSAGGSRRASGSRSRARRVEALPPCGSLVTLKSRLPK